MESVGVFCLRLAILIFVAAAIAAVSASGVGSACFS